MSTRLTDPERAKRVEGDVKSPCPSTSLRMVSKVEPRIYPEEVAAGDRRRINTYIEWLSSSAKATKQIGRKIGRFLRNGDVVALVGELGSGKTTLLKGMAKGLGVEKESEVTSPTFSLIHEYKGRHKIFHMDWYRLDSLKGSDKALVEECLDSQAVTLIEWADRGLGILPKEYLRIDLKHRGPRVRRIRLSAKGLSSRWKVLAA